MGKLDGRVALVTGASRGIGKAIAEVFAAEGARVVCTARTVEEGTHPLAGSLRTTVEGIQSAGGEAVAIAADVSQYDHCERAVREARDAFGIIDVLVNNAALTYFIPVAQFPVSKWLRSVAVNFHAPFYLSRLVLEEMVPRRSGAIVNISSGAAIGPGRGPYKEQYLAGGTLYGAEKAALERFTQGLAAEVYEHGISVTCVSPSLIVPTPGVMHHRLLREENEDTAEPPELMAKAALLLATEPLDKVTGRVTYSQEILREFGQLEDAKGIGIDIPGSGYSQV
jgi:NAD(P)-dependent dehydrogenase (short-subunit alcohol dehydrogenase family)